MWGRDPQTPSPDCVRFGQAHVGKDPLKPPNCMLVEEVLLYVGETMWAETPQAPPNCVRSLTIPFTLIFYNFSTRFAN